MQYWLEQNARLLATTIQALEVQRMTLSTLKTMNVPLAELQTRLLPETPSNWPGLLAEMLNAATQAATCCQPDGRRRHAHGQGRRQRRRLGATGAAAKVVTGRHQGGAQGHA